MDCRAEIQIKTSVPALLIAAASTFIILLYLLVVSNVYPQDALRSEYENQCADQAYVQGEALLFQNPSGIENFIRHAL